MLPGHACLDCRVHTLQAKPEKWLLITGTVALFFSSSATMVVHALIDVTLEATMAATLFYAVYGPSFVV